MALNPAGATGAMAINTTTTPFPIFPTTPARRPVTEIRFSRWNNANAQPFLRRQRQQQEIEDDLRRHRRYDSATRIADADDSDSNSPAPVEFKSRGTPSAPSTRSIPGKASKYSKPPPRNHNLNSPANSHPAFRRITRVSRRPAMLPIETGEQRPGITVGENGVSYKIENAPFEFQYSYTETPKVKPLALREPPFVPFGPSTMPRPWTGRAPLPPSKKKLPEFDSFKLPPAGKKGVKPVQAPGPFLAGSGPKFCSASREEILGEPLAKEEVGDLIRGCLKTKRQLNMGRDGLTHNMLDNIHAHWKRRRVCKIKCKGVCTVDMDNVRQQLEEKTGGKIIYNRGGVLFLFRGRNYNYRTRPRFPLMLWKPVPPVYPRLVQRVPEGLTLEEATELRKRGRKVPPICRLGKNGVYSNLVNDVKEAFEECEFVRINCQGLHKSDCRKIGAKLKDLVPCILLSFEFEHILMWRGPSWKSSLPPSEDSHKEAGQPASDGVDAMLVNSADLLPEIYLGTPELPGEPKSVGAIKSFDLDPRLEKPSESVALVENDVNIGITKKCSPEEIHGHFVTSPNVGASMMHDSAATSVVELVINQEKQELGDVSSNEDPSIERPSETMFQVKEDISFAKAEDASEDMESVGSREVGNQLLSSQSVQEDMSQIGTEDLPHHEGNNQSLPDSYIVPTTMEIAYSATRSDYTASTDALAALPAMDDSLCQKHFTSTGSCLDGVMDLLRQAIQDGSAIILDNESLDADIVLERAVSLDVTAPPGPVFRHKIRKVQIQKVVNQNNKKPEQVMEVGEVVTIPEKISEKKKKSPRNSRRESFKQGFLDVVPHGSLGIDELAKLLS